MRLVIRAIAASLLLAGASCCGAAGQAGPTARDPMDEIRALESQIEEEAVATGAADCDQGCRAAESICSASERICAIAAELAEMDAMASCRRSERSCTEARRVVVERCTCPE